MTYRHPLVYRKSALVCAAIATLTASSASATLLLAGDASSRVITTAEDFSAAVGLAIYGDAIVRPAHTQPEARGMVTRRGRLSTDTSGAIIRSPHISDTGEPARTSADVNAGSGLVANSTTTTHEAASNSRSMTRSDARRVPTLGLGSIMLYRRGGSSQLVPLPAYDVEPTDAGAAPDALITSSFAEIVLDQPALVAGSNVAGSAQGVTPGATLETLLTRPELYTREYAARGVAEPATLMLFALGLGGLALQRRRRAVEAAP